MMATTEGKIRLHEWLKRFYQKRECTPGTDHSVFVCELRFTLRFRCAIECLQKHVFALECSDEIYPSHKRTHGGEL